MYKNFVLLSLIAAVYLISGLNIFACDLAVPQFIKDDKQFEAILKKNYASAVTVFTGKVVSTNTKILGKETVRFKIEKIWKGKVKNEIKISNGLRRLKVRTLKGGLPGRSSCDYLFESGEKYLVFAFESEFGDIYSTLPSLTDKLKDADRTINFLNKIKKGKNNHKFKA